MVDCFVSKNITVEFVFDRDARSKEPIQVQLSLQRAQMTRKLSNNTRHDALTVQLMLKSGLLITNQI